MKKVISILIIFLGIITYAHSETSWIKKKDKTETIKKVEEKPNSTWIKKKIKLDKKEYKKEEKEITKEVKSWITKKSNDKYIDSIDKLPENAIYFTASNETKDLLVYGYVQPDVNSKLINGYYETSKGFGYFNDGKTTCKIGSTVIDVSSGEVTARVSGECTNGIKFTGKTSQNQSTGMGFAKTKDGKNRFLFDFNIQRTEIAKLFDINKKFVSKLPPKDTEKKTDIKFSPDGKYYALLIGNSKYAKWTNLSSPKKDIDGIYKALKENYDFEKIFKINDASRSEIYNAFKKLIKISTDKDYVLIYYSGHGERTENQAYWIPVESDKDWGGGSWINTSDIHVAISKIQAKHILLMSDSCYVGTAFKGDNDEISKKKIDFDTKLLRNNFMQRSRLFISSGGNSQVMDEVVNGHSLFAYKLIDLLNNEKKYLSSSSIFNQINRYNSQFIFENGYNQSPVIGAVSTWGHLGGDFIFIPKKNLK